MATIGFGLSFGQIMREKSVEDFTIDSGYTEEILPITSEEEADQEDNLELYAQSEPQEEQVIETKEPTIITPIEELPKEEPLQDMITYEDEIKPDAYYYVQMGAFAKTPCKKLIKKIDNAGYRYEIKRAVVNGRNLKLVVVGPYESRDDAKLSLEDLQDISKNAFIKKIKD